MNLELFKDGTKAQRFLGEVPLSTLAKSPHNPRQTYDDKRVAALAEHMAKTGYDVTRAVKVHRGEDGALLVFAGSTRLIAAEKAGIKAIPAFEFVGYDDGEIWRLSYEDNDSDGKHSTLPITDVWADYAAQAAKGMTQDEIAASLGLTRVMVSYRVRFNSMGAKVKRAVNDGLMTEYALTQIVPLVNALTKALGGWMTGDDLFEQVVEQCIAKKSDEAERKQLVERAKKMAALAASHYESLPAEPMQAHAVVGIRGPADPYKLDLRADFVKRLATAKARTQSDVQAVIDKQAADVSLIKEKYAAWLKAQASEAATIAAEAEEKQRKAAERARLRPVIHFKSCLDGMPEVEDGSVDLVIADPPYGSMTAERDTVRSGKAVKNDLAPWDEELCDPVKLDAFNEKWISIAARKLRAGGSMYVCGTRHNLPSVMTRLAGAGLELLNLITWYKPNSTPTFQNDRFAFAAEYLVLARKGGGHFFDYEKAKSYTSIVAPTKQAEDAQLRDVWVIPVCGGAERVKVGGKAAHPTQKPESLYEILAAVSCAASGLIVDPFAGSGTTAVVARRLGMRSVSYEIDKAMRDVISGRLEDMETTA